MAQMCPECSADNPDGGKSCGRCQAPLWGLLGQGTVLEGRYRIKQVLGCGGMGAVYLADDLRMTRRQVAIKENLETTRQAQQQFQIEVDLMVPLRHPNLPAVSDQLVGPSGRQYVVMDYIEGETLESVVLRHGPLSEAEALPLIEQLLEVLGYLHKHKIIHRDIKPTNIKLTPEGKVVLVDFGIAKLFAPGQQTHTAARGYVTPGYAPLEQYGTGTDARSDIYSLGAVLYYLLTGQTPPRAPDLATGMALPPPSQVGAKVSPALQQVILRAMAINPTQRFQSVAEMRQALSPSAVGGKRSAPPPVRANPGPQTRPRTATTQPRPWLLPMLVGGMGLLSLGLLAVIVMSMAGVRTQAAGPPAQVGVAGGVTQMPRAVGTTQVRDSESTIAIDPTSTPRPDRPISTSMPPISTPLLPATMQPTEERPGGLRPTSTPLPNRLREQFYPITLREPKGTRFTTNEQVTFEWGYGGSLMSGYTFGVVLSLDGVPFYPGSCQKIKETSCSTNGAPKGVSGTYKWHVVVYRPNGDIAAWSTNTLGLSWQEKDMPSKSTPVSSGVASPIPTSLVPTATPIMVTLYVITLKEPRGLRYTDEMVTFEWDYGGSLPAGYTFGITVHRDGIISYPGGCQRITDTSCSTNGAPNGEAGTYTWYVAIYHPNGRIVAQSSAMEFSWQPRQ
jgi:serine/threonine protein kinase